MKNKRSHPKQNATPVRAVELFCGIGDIRLLHSRVPPHDLLTAGFPCQPFSSAGKKQGTRDPRGTLFEEIVKVLRSCGPRWFVLENVKRLLSMEKGDHFATILNATAFGLPQNRQRIVIVGTRISAPQGDSIALASHEDLKKIIRNDLRGLQNLDNWRSLKKHREKFPTWGVCLKGQFYACDLDTFSVASDTPYLNAVLESNPSDEFFMDETTLERLKNSVFVNKLVDGVRILYNQSGGARMGYTVFGTDGVAPALTASHSRHYERYKIGTRYRRLTNTEYARLQGFPDNHCSGASVFDQYGLYGNAVPPPLAQWSIERVLGDHILQISSLEPVKHSQLSLDI